jgi:hypothetical protein
MIIKLVLNPQTLEISLQDSEITVNEIKTMKSGDIFIELSKADPEVTQTPGLLEQPWQQ